VKLVIFINVRILAFTAGGGVFGGGGRLVNCSCCLFLRCVLERLLRSWRFIGNWNSFFSCLCGLSLCWFLDRCRFFNWSSTDLFLRWT
jgi:hypothetical protein